MKSKCLLCFLMLLLGWENSCLYANSKRDSLYVHPATKFHAKQLILPGSLIVAGSLGFLYDGLNDKVREGMGNLRGDHYFHIDDYIQYLPVTANLTMDFMGIKAKSPFTDRLMVTATAYLSMGVLVNSVKFLVDEKRPDSSAQNSFPSGHAATAFMGAELVRQEYGLAYGIGAYSVACTVAFFRLYNNRHWLNDVLAGAGLGILSTRIGYWLLPATQKLFKPKKKQLVMVSPFYQHRTNAFGAGLVAYF